MPTETNNSTDHRASITRARETRRRERKDRQRETRDLFCLTAGQVARNYCDGDTRQVVLTLGRERIEVTDESFSGLREESLLRAAVGRSGGAGAALLTVRGDRAAVTWSGDSTDPEDWWIYFAALSPEGDLTWVASDESLHDHLRQGRDT